MKKIISTLALSFLLVSAAQAQRRTVTYLTFENTPITTPDAQAELDVFTPTLPDFVQDPSGGPAINQQLAWRNFPPPIGTLGPDIITTPSGISNPGSVNVGSRILETAATDSGEMGGLYLFTESGAGIPAQDVTIECIWYTSNTQPGGNELTIQTVWGKESLTGQEIPGLQLRSFDTTAIAPTPTMDWRTEAPNEVVIRESNALAANTWYHDTLVIDYDETTPANSTMRAYRNGVETSNSPVTIDASSWTNVLFTIASDFDGDAAGDRFLGIGFNSSSQGTSPDNIRSLVGGIDGFAITLGTPLTPAEFVLTTGSPFDAPGAAVGEWMQY